MIKGHAHNLCWLGSLLCERSRLSSCLREPPRDLTALAAVEVLVDANFAGLLRASPLTPLIGPLGAVGVKFGLQPCPPNFFWCRRARVIYPALPVETQFLGRQSGASAGGEKQAGQHCRRLGENISLFPPKLAPSFSLFPPKLATISPSTTAELLTPAIPQQRKAQILPQCR
jgi:hypothetical protein